MIKSASIKKCLQDEGATLVKIAPANSLPNVKEAIENSEKENLFGDMKWLSKTANLRTTPEIHLQNARSIICSAWPYSTIKSKYFARYSLCYDYHEFILEKLEFAWDRFPVKKKNAKFCVDSKAIAEKAYSEKAGLGWIGKNGLLINKDIGSFFCIGLIITDLEFEIDVPAMKQCSTCQKCIDACPTKAIIEPGKIDCNKCIAYLTTEHKGNIPEKIRHKIGKSIFGCDICQEACPFNQRKTTNNIIPRILEVDSIKELLKINEEDFKNLFKGTAISRIGRNRLLRNITISLGNSADKKALPLLTHSLQDKDDLIRRNAQWAIEEIEKRST